MFLMILEQSWDIFCYMIGEYDFMKSNFFRMSNDNKKSIFDKGLVN